MISIPLLSTLTETEQYEVLLSLIETDEMSLYEFFAEPPTWMGDAYVRSRKRQIVLQLLLESFINE